MRAGVICSSAWRRGAALSGLRTRLLLWSAVAAYTVGFGAESIWRHRAFSTGRFDLGNMVQAVWSTAHGHPLRVTDLRGDQISRLAAHVDPILVAFAPLWLIWPHPSTLLVAQALAVALGAVPVFWLARKHLQSERAALGFALAYLLYSPVQWLTLNEFHPVALACPLLLFAFWFLDEDRLLAFAVVALVAVTTKEEIGLVVAAMGVWYALSRRRWRAAGLIAIAGTAWTAIAVGLIIPHFNHGPSSFYARYAEVGGSPGGILKTTVTRPDKLATAAFGHRGVRYLAELLLPLAALWALAPLVLLAALPELAINLVSAAPTQKSIHFHYTAGLIPALMVASVLGAARFSHRRAATLAAVAVAASLIGNYLLGPIPFWASLPGGESLQAHAGDVTAHDRVAARALRVIPPDDVVSATNSLGAHLSARRRILSFPFVRDATWIAVDEKQLSVADPVSPAATRAALARIRANPAWQLVFGRDGVLVFEKV